MRALHPGWFREDLERLFGLLPTGTIRPRVAERISFDEVAEVHRRLEAGGLAGKLVLCPELPPRRDRVLPLREPGGNDRNARFRWLSVRLTLAPRITSILDAFSSKLCSRRRRRIDEILALAYAGHVEVNDSLARFYSRRVRGLRRADPYRIRFRQ
jgi:hypothetical protein